MGRELKRVPLDFDWPLKKVWKGYINPHWKPCPEKDRTCLNGVTPGRAWFKTIVRLLLTAASDAAYAELGRDTGRIFPHPYLTEMQTAPHTDGDWDPKTRTYTKLPRIVPPTKELADLTEGLCGRRSDGLLGHDAGDAWEAEEKIIEAAGMPKDWGVCPVCNGSCIDPEVEEAYEAWEEEEPPEGEGYQLWSTTDEGHPVSPVFETLDALCEWCETGATTFGSFRASSEEWKKLDGGVVSHREGNNVFL